MPAVVTELLALLKLDDSSFKRGMAGAKKDANSFGDRMKSAGQKVSDFGNKMTMVTAPIALGLGVAINQSRQFDKSMANVNAILGITGQEAADLRKELLAYGGSTRQGPQEVADAYYDIVSGVADATTHMAILDAAVRTADAGQAELKATTSSLISTMNSYGFAAEDAAFVSDVFTKTVGMGVLTMDELASAMPQVTGLAASLGIEINDVGAQMAFLTSQGFAASQSATFLKSMMTTLLNPTATLQTAINDLGYDTGEAMIANLGLVGSYEALKQYNNGTFAGLITNQEALQGATALTKDTFADFNTTFQETVEGSTEAAKAIQDEQASWDLLTSKMGEVSIQAGDVLAPVLMDLIDDAILPLITEIGNWMQENPELTQQLIMLGGAAVVLGPVLSGLGSIVTGVTAIMGSAAAPIIAIGAAIAGVIHQVNEFNRVTAEGRDFARQELGSKVMSGEISKEQLDEAAFGAVAAEFGGGFIGDLAARLTYTQFSDALTPLEMKADGGSVAGGRPYMVGEQGPELFVPDSSGEIVPNGAMGAPTINVYQLPGEDGVQLADRISRKMVQLGYARS